MNELDMIVLSVNIAAHELKVGDVGTVVQRYADGYFDAEFVTACGHTQAIVTLTADDVRPVRANDLLAVRSMDAA